MSGTRSPTALRLSPETGREIVAHVRAAAPLEGVGLLAVAAEGPDDRATRFYPGTNVDASPTRYTMEPAEVLAAFRDIEANGWRLGAIVHSHPGTPPLPSATDLREAHYPDALLLIVGLAGGAPSMRAWRLILGTGDAPVATVEVPVVVDPAADPLDPTDPPRRSG